MNCSVTVAGIEETGALGVVWLKRLWSRAVSGQTCPQEQRVTEWRAWHVLLSGLQLGLEPAMIKLYCEHPDFAAFESWIVEVNGGQLPDPEVVARLNAALLGQPVPTATATRLASIDQMPPVLTEAELAQWDEQGWVVLRQAIPAAAAAASADVVWLAQGMNPDNPGDWQRSGPLQQCVFVQMFRHPVLDANRHSSRIHKALSQLWGTSDLWVSTDRIGFNAPDTPLFPFPGPGMHWDVSLTQPIPLGVQGLIYLSDTTADQGAFALVPGMHRTIGDWLAQVPAGQDPRQYAEATLTMTPIAAQAGDMVLWHHALPHGPTPNHTDRPRLVQYMTMFPADFGYNPVWL